MTLRRKLLIAGAAGLTLLIAVFIVVALNFGRVAKAAIEYAGPRVLGVPVTVDRVFLSPFFGRGGISGLRIGNPSGYRDPHLLTVGSISVSVELGSLATSLIRIRHVIVKEPQVFWEGGLSSKSNVSVLQRHAQSFSGPATPSAAKKKGPGKRLYIGTFRLERAHVSARVRELGGGALALTLPDIELHGIGAGRGATVGEAVALVLDKLGDGVLDAVRKTPRFLGDAVKAVGEGVGNAAVKGLKSIFR